MKGRDFKDAMYDGLAKLLKALSNPFRLEIIEMLSQGEKSVEGIVQSTNLNLQVLKNNNIVKSRKEKQYVFYTLVNNEVLTLMPHNRLVKLIPTWKRLALIYFPLQVINCTRQKE